MKKSICSFLGLFTFFCSLENPVWAKIEESPHTITTKTESVKDNEGIKTREKTVTEVWTTTDSKTGETIEHTKTTKMTETGRFQQGDFYVEKEEITDVQINEKLMEKKATETQASSTDSSSSTSETSTAPAPSVDVRLPEEVFKKPFKPEQYGQDYSEAFRQLQESYPDSPLYVKTDNATFRYVIDFRLMPNGSLVLITFKKRGKLQRKTVPVEEIRDVGIFSPRVKRHVRSRKPASS